MSGCDLRKPVQHVTSRPPHHNHLTSRQHGGALHPCCIIDFFVSFFVQMLFVLVLFFISISIFTFLNMDWIHQAEQSHCSLCVKSLNPAARSSRHWTSSAGFSATQPQEELTDFQCKSAVSVACMDVVRSCEQLTWSSFPAKCATCPVNVTSRAAARKPLNPM